MSDPVHSDRIQKVAPPAYLLKRLETFQIGKGGKVTYLLRDKVASKNYDLEPWQFFVLEVIPGVDSFARLASVFQDRFGRTLQRKEVEDFLSTIADNKLFNEDAGKHPLLQPFYQRAYEVADGKAVLKPLTSSVIDASAAWAEKAASTKGEVAKPEAEKVAPPAKSSKADAKPKELPAGIKDVFGIDPKAKGRIQSLFDPRPALKAFAPALNILNYTTYVLPLLLISALILAVWDGRTLMGDMGQVFSVGSLITELLIGAASLYLLSTLSTAVAAHTYRGTVSGLGLGLESGILPRFVAVVGHAEQFTRRERIWLHAAPLLTRCVLFSAGVWTWYLTRGSASLLEQMALGMVIVSAIDILFVSGNPLFKGNAYFALAAFCDEGNLRSRAFNMMQTRLRGKTYKETENDVLVAYSMMVGISMLLIAAFAVIVVNGAVKELSFSGSAIILITAVTAYVLNEAYVRLRNINEAYERAEQFNRWRDRTLASEAEAAQPKKQDISAYAKRAIPVMLLIVLMLPYSYEAGGNIVIYPLQKSQIAPDVTGIVDAVYFDGGETVKKGTPIAHMKDDDNMAKLQESTAKVKEQEWVVDNLKTLPKPEAIKVAEVDLQIAVTHEQFSAEKVPRMYKMYKQGAISFDEYDQAKKSHDVDMDQVKQKQAQLALAKTGPTKDEIAAAEAKLESLKAERDGYQDKVNRANLLMPFDGHILTLHLKDKLNQYLDKGKFFAEVEDTSKVTVEIDVPESDIGHVQLGQKIRARPQAYNDEEFTGKVTMIDPNVTVLSTGNIVKVIAVIENKDGKLKTNMSGYAKIEAPRMPVWKAFSLAILRFFNVDVWSWIP